MQKDKDVKKIQEDDDLEVDPYDSSGESGT
jgi:hypothetical protein